MTNCVHPKIVWEALSHPFNQCDAVRTRFRGIQANTSSLSYDMLDASQALHTSDPDDLARWMIRLNDRNCSRKAVPALRADPAGDALHRYIGR